MNETIEGLCKEAAYHAQQYEEKLAAATYLNDRLTKLAAGMGDELSEHLFEQALLSQAQRNQLNASAAAPAAAPAAAEAAPAAAEAAPGIMDKIKGYYNSGVDTAKDYYNSGKNWAKAHPYKASGGAGAAGLAGLAGLYGLFGRKPQPGMLEQAGNWISQNPYTAAGVGALGLGAAAAPFLMGGEKEGSYKGSFDNLNINEKIAVYKELLQNY